MARELFSDQNSKQLEETIISGVRNRARLWILRHFPLRGTSDKALPEDKAYKCDASYAIARSRVSPNTNQAVWSPQTPPRALLGVAPTVGTQKQLPPSEMTKLKKTPWTRVGAQ